MNAVHPPDTVDGFVGFLIRRIGLDVSRVIERVLAPTGITARELRVLSFLSTGELSQRELGHRAGLDRTTMVAVVDHLEEIGCAARRRSETDRRKNVITLTPAGRKTCATAMNHLTAAEDDYLKSLTIKQRDALRSALQTLHANHHIDC